MKYTCEDCGQPCKAVVVPASIGPWVESDCCAANVLNERGEIVTLAEAVATWGDDGAKAQGA
jgi:hypothetical protein